MDACYQRRAPPASRAPRRLADLGRQPVGDPLLVVDLPLALDAVERDQEVLGTLLTWLLVNGLIFVSLEKST